MSKVQRFDLMRDGAGYRIDEDEDGLYVLHTDYERDVGELVAALRNLAPWCVTDVLEHCDGNKCREMWCAGCFGDDQAEANVAKAREALKAARAALSNLDSQERGG